MGRLSTRGRIFLGAAYDVHRRSARFACLLRTPGYFVDTAGRPVYLTGSHTWNNLQDLGYTDPPDQFDFEEYLRFLELHNHNFIRMWRSESPQVSVPGRVMYVAPHPWLRTGPGAAADGKARFDLTKFDPAYLDRLRTRVQSAAERGFYVSVMLFEGWGMRFSIDGYNAHPFTATNNVNGIDCDPNRDGNGSSASRWPTRR